MGFQRSSLRERLENFLKKAQERKAGLLKMVYLPQHIGTKELYVNLWSLFEKYGAGNRLSTESRHQKKMKRFLFKTQ